MKKIITGSLTVSLLIGFGLNGEATDKQKTVSSTQINQAKEVPTFHGSYVGAPMKGRFDEDGFDVWYMDSADFVADGTHLEFKLDWDIYGTVFTSKQTPMPAVSTTGTSNAMMRRCTSRSAGKGVST
ncbi:hypothetical protein [Exiguobacterium antarcticum]|uniref:hypothetical protein n=1 Tax=Exiguobacterium antarcticum TaxID=132920 RepID=UPI000479A868|nr:hypothetical protein [Exiguobacterium antarcticum]